ncbi:MAG: cell division protein FtsZ [Ectothiorhodospiraceae bacterium]|nr:cell division protein FtsZ [Ectothiorhodospiraceae bacterium]
MAIVFDSTLDQRASIRVVGVGGGGGNSVEDMIARGINNVDFIVVNTDVQALERSNAQYKVQAGKNLTRGLGAGADPSVGYRAVEEDKEEIAASLSGSDMVFVTAGMGGGTGTGGAPVVANIAKGTGSLVVGIVTKPFHFEGRRRMAQAEEGIEELRKHVDTLIVIPNQKLLSLVDKNTPVTDAFGIANQVLFNATRGIAEIITVPGLVNVDFADVRTTMRDMGDALMGSGIAKGDNRAVEAAHQAISSPLLDGVSIGGAQGVLINVTGSSELSMLEIDEASSIIIEAAGEDANVIFGAVVDETMEDEVMVTVIATGFNKRNAAISRNQIGQRQPSTSSKINHIPTGVNDLKDLDMPAFMRKGTLTLTQNESEDDQHDDAGQEERSKSDRPAFLRKIMD